MGKGTYGSKVGRPKKKKSKFQGFSGITGKQVESTVSKKKKKTSKVGAKRGATSKATSKTVKTFKGLTYKRKK